MINIGSYFNIADNSGAKLALCIGTLNKKNISIKLGDLIIVVIKSIRACSKIKIASMFRALVIRTKYPFRDIDGTIIMFKDNAIILIDKNNIPIGTRIFGVVSHKSLKHNLIKVQSLTCNII